MVDADTLPETLLPLAVDIDGTLTDEHRVIDPRVMPVLGAWPAPVVIATGKSMPYPIALCEFVGRDPTVIAENGGIVLVGREGTFQRVGDDAAVEAFTEDFLAAGYDFGWGEANLVNRWRETEVAIDRSVPYDPVVELATEHGLEVFDTGFAYHVTTAGIDKGTGLATVADTLGLAAGDFVAVGDSENDAAMLDAVGWSFAVANADDAAKRAADAVTDGRYADGFLEAVEALVAIADDHQR